MKTLYQGYYGNDVQPVLNVLEYAEEHGYL